MGLNEFVVVGVDRVDLFSVLGVHLQGNDAPIVDFIDLRLDSGPFLAHDFALQLIDDAVIAATCLLGVVDVRVVAALHRDRFHAPGRDALVLARAEAGEPKLSGGLDDNSAESTVFKRCAWVVEKFCSLDVVDIVKNGKFEDNLPLHDVEVDQVINQLLLEWLFADQPAKLDVLALQTKEADLGLAIGEAVTDEANELHVEKMDDLLGLFLVSHIDHDDLSVVGGETLVNHQGVVDLHGLVIGRYHPLDGLVGRGGFVEVDIRLLDYFVFGVAEEEGTQVGILTEENGAGNSLDVVIAKLVAVVVLRVAGEG